MNYYRADNAARQWAGVQFTIYAIVAGTASGVYATENPKEIEKLDASIGNKSPVTKITAEEYESCLQKKTATLMQNAWSPSPVITSLEQKPIKGEAPAVVVTSPAPELAPEPLQLASAVESVEDAMRTDKVELPPAPAEVAKPSKKNR